MAEISIRKVLDPKKTYYFVWVNTGAGGLEVVKTTGLDVHASETIGHERLVAIFDVLDSQARKIIDSYRVPIQN